MARTTVVSLLVLSLTLPLFGGVSASGQGSGLPDLVAVHLFAEPTSPQEGDSVTFHAAVRNEGNASASNFTVQFRVDNVVLSEHFVGGLGPGRVVNFTSAPWAAEASNHTIAFLVDPGQRVNETSDANNNAVLFLVVPPRPGPGQPDLVAMHLFATPAAPQEGDSVTFHAAVRNQGNASAGNFTLQFRVDNVVLSEIFVAGMAPDQVLNVTSAPWTAQAGNHTIAFVVDPDDRVSESNESNNYVLLFLQVGPRPPPARPDLVVREIRIVPQAPAEGDDVTFGAAIGNAGDANATAFRVRFLLDDTTVVGDVTVAGLAAGGSVKVRSPAWRAAQGDHTITVIADATGVVNESDEANNAATRSFSVAPPPRVSLFHARIDLALVGDQAALGAFTLDRAYGEIELRVTCPNSVGAVALLAVPDALALSEAISVCGAVPLVRIVSGVLQPGPYLSEVSAAGSGVFEADVTGVAL